MLYVLGALGIGGVIVTLLMLMYRAKFQAAAREKEIVEVDRDGWRQINIINEALKDEVVKNRRDAMFRRLKELHEKVEQSNPGDVIDDVTGTGRGGQL